MKKISIVIILFLLIAAYLSLPALAENQDSANAPAAKTSIFSSVTNWYMDNMNYASITLLMAVESSFIPFPSEIVVPPAAYKATQKPEELNIALVVLCATLGALIGATINYYLALWLGRPVVYRFAESRLGRMCLLSGEKIKHAEDYFARYGKISTFIGRLVPAVRQLISIPAGLVKMNFASFLLYTGMGALIWNITLAVVGYVAHGNADLINQYSDELSTVLIGLGILFVLYLLYNGFLRKK